MSLTSRSWLHRAGYTTENIRRRAYSAARQFLGDLKKLSDLLGLVVVGRHHRRNEWKSLAQMVPLLKNEPGWAWLWECTVRVFAPADYLIRWRYLISKKLGFRWIPGGEECPFEQPKDPANPLSITDSVALQSWLTRRGWTRAKLAAKLRVRRETVSRHISGKRNSAGFWTAVTALANRIFRREAQLAA